MPPVPSELPHAPCGCHDVALEPLGPPVTVERPQGFACQDAQVQPWYCPQCQSLVAIGPTGAQRIRLADVAF